MQPSIRPRRVWLFLPVLLLLVAALAVWLKAEAFEQGADPDEAVKGRRTSGQVDAQVVRAPAAGMLAAPAQPASGFAPQTRLGYTSGDQWEPAIAADHFGHVYMLYPQYLGVPGCATCPSPTMILQISADRGATWAAPRQIAPPGSGQVDAQIAVDPVDGRTVYAAWLQNNKSDIAVAKSTDFGATWSLVLADRTNAGTDKPIVAVRGRDVYVAYDTSGKVWVSSSHDGGATFISVNINPNGQLGLSLAGGGTVDPAGNVYFSWDGFEQHGQAKGPVNLYISKSADGGQTWSSTLIDTSSAAPDCSAYLCGWAYLSAQITMTSDASGTLYALWNAGRTDGGPERMYFARSTDAGASWSPGVDVSSAASGVNHSFPAIAAGAAGDVRIAWMDTRAGTLWNTYERRSTNGGASWSAETDLSTYVAGYSYIQPGGFSFPFGDYFEIALDDQATAHVVWGEGLNYDSPGSIWYTRGK